MIRIRFVSLFFVTIMIMGSLQSLTMFNIRNTEVTTNSELSSVDIIGLIPDPDFDSAPEFVINGSSSEFMTEYFDATGEEDKYVELVWNHTANTTLDFTSQDPYQILPDCNDFVYIYQEFDWPYDMRPNDAEVYLRFRTYRTGDFAEGVHENSNLMFRVFVWAIDSSGNWIKIYETRDAIYSEEYQTRIADLNFFTLSDIFDGMVKQDGVQEDPLDTVKIAIGLAPTIRFENYLTTEPWRFYNGSVSIAVTFCDFYAYIETDESVGDFQPVYNVTYGTTFGDVFPNHQNATYEVWDQCEGMVVGPDGAVYITGNSRSPYDLYVSEGLRFRNQFLLKYSPTLDLLWAVENENNTEVRSMAVHGDFIYTTGYNDTDDYNKQLLVTKWSSSGTKIWETEWGKDSAQVGVGVAVHEDGSVYVIASDYDFEGWPGYQNSSLLKFDSDGLLIWDKQPEYLLTLFDQRGDLYIDQNYLYFLFGSALLVLNLEGDPVSGGVAQAAIPDGNNGFYEATSDYIGDGARVSLSHRNATGYPYWNTTYARQWVNGRYYNYRPMSMALGPEDKLFLLIYSQSLSYEFSLLTYKLNGTLLDNRTIASNSWPLGLGVPIFMQIGNSGLGYFAFDVYTENLDINVQAFKLYEITDGLTSTIALAIIVTSTIVIIGAGAGIIRWKRRNP